MGTRVTRTFDMCPCKRATGPAALQSRHLPRVEGVGFTGRKQATIRGVGFHFPRAFFFALLPLLPRFTRVCRCARVFSFVFVSSPLSLSLSLVPPPPFDTSEAARCSAHFRRFVGHEGPRANYKNTETSGGRLERALESAVPARSRTKRAAR